MLNSMNKSLIKVKKVSLNELMKVLFINNVDVEIIKEEKDYIICSIKNTDIDNVNKLYNIEIIKDFSIKEIINYIRNKLYILLLLFFAIVLFVFLSNIIVEVNILSNNLDLVKELNKTLDNYGIRRLTLKKNFIEIKEIKEKILSEYNEKLEWLEIEQKGMIYEIKLEERKKENIQKSEGNCNIVAKTDGIITKIIATNGVVLVENNQVVKENDVLISGQISLNDEIMANICAKGLVYAEKWYNVSIEIPKIYNKKKYTNKIRYNIEIENGNNDYRIFKSHLKNYDSDKSEIISLLGKKIYLIREYEYINEELVYSEDALNKRVDDLIKEKLELSLGDNEKIIRKNVLKKDENDSKIKIELFVTIERLISKQVTYEVLEKELTK